MTQLGPTLWPGHPNYAEYPSQCLSDWLSLEEYSQWVISNSANIIARSKYFSTDLIKGSPWSETRVDKQGTTMAAAVRIG